MSEAIEYLSTLSVEDKTILDRFLWTTSSIPSAEGMVRSRLESSPVSVKELGATLCIARLLAAKLEAESAESSA